MSTTTTNPQFKAKTQGVSSKEFSKTNGGAYVLQNCVITEGPLKGLVVSGTRTIKNADGKAKELVPTDTEVILHLTRVPSTQDPSKMQNFFDISTGLSASQDDINAKLALMLAGGVAESMGSEKTF